jgi:hypothetical protein
VITEQKETTKMLRRPDDIEREDVKAFGSRRRSDEHSRGDTTNRSETAALMHKLAELRV